MLNNTLYQLLEYSQQKFPNNVAFIEHQQTINYQQFQLLVKHTQIKLQEARCMEGDRVAIYAAKSIQTIACIFSTLSLNAAYVPLDVNAPEERNKTIILNCEPKFICCEKKFQLQLSEHFEFITDLGDLILLKNRINSSKLSPENLAYILHTSGSTGIPKGVMYTHGAAIEFIDWCSTRFNFSEKDCFSSYAPFHFDLSIFDIYVSIKHGARLVLIDEVTSRQPLFLSKLIHEFKITIWYSTPTTLNLMCEYGKLDKYDLSSLKTIIFAGEVYPLAQFKKLMSKLPNCQYLNFYGPTETNVCTYYQIDSLSNLTEIPIGIACEHYNSKIADNKLEGELLISGNGLMVGYWGDELQPTDKFEVDKENICWYKTGDIVTRDSNNNYLFKGRIDRMIKRRGYRIELDEIEKNLLKHPDMLACAVISKPGEFSQVIIAFIVLKTEKTYTFIDLKSISAQLLPGYMIPDEFITVEKIPSTSSHKTDYQKLLKEQL
jgi:amino acid adenylation domain-containing protein